jgi:dihydrofolate reductase
MTPEKSVEFLFAINQDGIIGIENRLPWHIPEDLAYFRKMTLGSIVVMGRKTYDSVPNSVFKGRHCIVLTRSCNNPIPRSSSVSFCDFEHVWDKIESIREQTETRRVFVIGGGQLFSLFYPYATKMWITDVRYVVAEHPELVRFTLSPDDIHAKYQIDHCSDVFFSKNESIPYMFIAISRK